MLNQLHNLFEGGFDFETAAAMVGIKTEEGAKIAARFWAKLERNAEATETE